jgi:hypothetical protein
MSELVNCVFDIFTFLFVKLKQIRKWISSNQLFKNASGCVLFFFQIVFVVCLCLNFFYSEQNEKDDNDEPIKQKAKVETCVQAITIDDAIVKFDFYFYIFYFYF